MTDGIRALGRRLSEHLLSRFRGLPLGDGIRARHFHSTVPFG